MASDDVHQLNQLAYRYACAVDTCDTQKFLSVFTPDARLRAYNPGETEPFNDLQGHEQIAGVPETMRGMFERTMHTMTNHMIELNGDSATGNLLCIARHTRQGSDEVLIINLRYEDVYARIGGEWKIIDRQLRFLWGERAEITGTGF